MNKLTIFIFCATVANISSNELIRFKATSGEMAALLEQAAKCSAEADSPKDSMLLVLHHEFSDSEPMKKFIYCWTTKSNFIDDSKTVFMQDNIDHYLADKNQLDLLHKSLDECNAMIAKTDQDKVQKAYELVKCFTSKNPQFSFDSQK